MKEKTARNKRRLEEIRMIKRVKKRLTKQEKKLV